MLSKLINFITLGFLARVLGPEQLGFYNAVQNGGNYVNMMCSFGTSIVVQRIGARIIELGSKTVSEVFSNAFTLYLLLNAIASVSLLIFPQFFFNLLLDSQGNISYVVLISEIVILNALGQVPLYLILGLEEFKKYSIRNLLSTIVILGVSAVFILLMEDNLRAAFNALVVSFFLNAVLTGWVFYNIVKKHELKIRLSLRLKVLRQVMSEGFIYYVGNTFLGAMTGLVTISLFFNHLTSFDYGFTRIGNAFAMLLAIVPSAIQPVTISLLSVENAKNIYIKSLQIRLIPFMSTLILMIAAFNMELILGVFFGSNYIGAKDIVFGMILIQIPNTYLGLINNYQVGAGHLNYIGFVAILGCLIMMGCSLYLIPLFGIKGYFASIYIATILALILVAYREYFTKNQLTIYDWRSVFLIGGMIVLSYLMMYVVPEYLRIPFTFIAIIAASFLFWWFCMLYEERKFLLVELNQRLLALRAK